MVICSTAGHVMAVAWCYSNQEPNHTLTAIRCVDAAQKPRIKIEIWRRNWGLLDEVNPTERLIDPSNLFPLHHLTSHLHTWFCTLGFELSTLQTWVLCFSFPCSKYRSHRNKVSITIGPVIEFQIDINIINRHSQHLHFRVSKILHASNVKKRIL